jgi:hypothetical protein
LAGGEGKAAFAEIIMQRQLKRRKRENAWQDNSGSPAAEQQPQELPEGETRASVPTIEVKFASVPGDLYGASRRPQSVPHRSRRRATGRQVERYLANR